MTITNRKLAILSVAAVVLLTFTIVLYSWNTAGGTTFAKGTLLIQGLDPAEVARIVVKAGAQAATLARGKDGYLLADRSNYPASTKDVNDLFIKCLDVRVNSKITSSPENFEALGVADDKPATASVKFYDDKGKTLVGLLVGKSAQGGGNYVRLAGSNDVYASAKYTYLEAGPTAYADTSIVSVPKDDVESVTVGLKDGTYTIVREDGKSKLMDIPKGKQAKQYDVDAAANALSSLSFTDVRAAAAVKPAWDSTYTCRTNKHLVYVLRVGKLDGKDVVSAQVKGPTDEEVARSMSNFSPDEDKSELAKRDVVLTARDKAEKFNARHGRWVYQLADWQARNLHQPLSDLVEDIPKPKAEKTPKAGQTSKTKTAPKTTEAPKAAKPSGAGQAPAKGTPAPTPAQEK